MPLCVASGRLFKMHLGKPKNGTAASQKKRTQCEWGTQVGETHLADNSRKHAKLLN